jgi:aryl-alcohol dehydrogenase-like predicted oxidoreductase
VEGTAQRVAVVDAVLGIAEETGSSPVQVSLAWLRQRAVLAATTLVPILGPRSPEHLQEYLRSLDLELGDEHYRRLDEISAVRLGTPHEDVAASLSHGFDGDRTLLDVSPVPVL